MVRPIHQPVCSIVVLAVALLAVPGMGLAQQAPATPAKDKPQTRTENTAETTTVTVTGKKPSDSSDRQVYDVTKNPDANTGTAADALNKVPGVTVDPSGNVTLRGQNARVYLNGRPSLMLSGDNRGVALQSMPSAYVSSIEVISNPGAQYSSGSSNPIINIVTKRNMPPGIFGSVTAQAMSTGGRMANAFYSYTKGKLSLMASVAYNESRLNSTSSGTTQVFDASGANIRSSTFAGQSRTQFTAPFFMANLQYDLGDNDVLTGSFNYNQSTSPSTLGNDVQQRGAGGAVTDLFSSASDGRFNRDSGSASFGYTHFGQKPDESFKLDLSLSGATSDSRFRNTTLYDLSSVLNNSGTQIDLKIRRNNTRNANLEAVYNTTFGNTQVSVGTQITADTSRADNLAFGPAASDADLVLQPLLTTDFSYDQTVTALYGTVQRQIGARWTVLAGLRAEALALSTDEDRFHTHTRIDYVRVNPSLFAIYALSPKQKIRFNYTHKQQRPEPGDLNPRPVYNSATYVTVGNENLKPEEADSLEASYEYTGPSVTYALRGFYRFSDNTIITSSRIIPDPQNLGNLVTESTRLNHGFQRNSGATASFDKRWDRKLTFNADVTVTRIEMDSPYVSGARSDVALSGSISANYTFTNNNQLSLNYNLTGRRYTVQGYTGSYGMGSITYRHNLTSKVSLSVTVQDPLKATRIVNVTRTDMIQSRYFTERDAPTVSIGLSRRFGGFGASKK